jgi:IS30 family transposase
MTLSNRAIADALGVSHTIVNRAVKNGRIDPSKSIDQIRLDWARNADPLQRARRMGAVADRAVPEQAVRRSPVASCQE